MSGYTTTPNYGFRKPVVGADNDLWGGDWNLNADSLDTIIKNTNNLLAGYLPLAGGTVGPGALTIANGGAFSGTTEPRNPNIAALFTDAAGNANSYITADGAWQFGTLRANSGTVTTLTATTGTITNLTTPGLNATGGNPQFDTVTVKTAAQHLADARNPGVAFSFTDAAGASGGLYLQPDGTVRMGTAYINTANVTTLTATSYAPLALTMGQATSGPADRRNRYAQVWTDNTDQGALMLTGTGSLAFAPASGVLAKHLQSRIERSHVLTQGPPSHGDSANTVGVSGTTYHLTATLDSGGFDAVRLIIPSMRTPAGATITACIAPTANLTDRINPKDAAGNPVEWRPVTFGSAGADVDWEDQPYGTLSLTTNAITPVGTNVLSFASTTGVTVGMVVFASPFGSAFGIQLPGAWAQVTAVTPTTVTLNKNIQNLDLGTNWPVWFAPNSFALAAWSGFAGQHGSCANMQVSDWVPISSLDRSDGGRWPLLMVRVYANGNHTSLVTDLSQTNWQGLADDRAWSCYTQSGDFVSSPAGFTATTDNGTMIVGWLQFYSRSRGCTIMHAGDSITQGVGGLMIGMGATMLAVQALSTPTCPVTAVGVVNGWNNAGVGTVIWESAISHIDVFKPQVLALAPWTRNGEFSKPPAGFPAYAQEQADWYYQQTQRIVTKAWRKYRCQVLYFPTGPSDNAELTAATELVRMSAVNRARIANASGEMLLDQDVLLGTGTTPVNTSPYVGLHPPAPAQQVLALDLQRQYKSALGIA